LEVDVSEGLAEGRVVDGSDVGTENVSLVQGHGRCVVLAHPMVSARMIRMTVPRTPALPIAPTMAWLRDLVVPDSTTKGNIRYGIGGVARLLGDGHGAVEAAYRDERWHRAELWTADLQIVHTGARKERMNANPLGHPVRLVNPAKVNSAVLSSPFRAMGRPMMVARASATLRTTLGVCIRAKVPVKYAQ
jgi:hypothetical protein